MTDPPTAAATARRTPISPGRLDWLTGELTRWRDEHLIDARQVETIAERYEPTHRFNVAKLALVLGATFVGFGLIWLVAANLDELAPLWRFIAVAVIWLTALGTAEFLAGQRAHRHLRPATVIGAVRVLAVLAFGGVIFQAAQSLQVPAFEPRLLGSWAAGAVLYAYGVRAVGPLVIGLVVGSAWYISDTLYAQVSGLGVVLGMVNAGLFAVAVAALQERWSREFSTPWRELGAALLLSALFAAAIPVVDRSNFEWTSNLLAGVVLAVGTSAAAMAFGCGRARLEPLGAMMLGGVAVLLVWWEAGRDATRVDLATWAHVAVAVTAYVAAAAGVAVLGILRDSGRLTALATLALVVFTTFQSFAVFAPIIQGGVLFVVLGLIFL
ncbi:MAG: DUF2157 domain-containing protein, partial [Nocardioides sp.]